MKNKITIKVCGESKTNNLIISKYLPHLLRMLNTDISNKDYPVNDVDHYFIAKNMDKLIRNKVSFKVETIRETDYNTAKERFFNRLYPKQDQFSDVFPDKPISIKVKIKKKNSVTDYPSSLDEGNVWSHE